MRLQKTPLPDLYVVELNVLGDARGFFVERFSEQKFAALGLPTKFVQDNHSRSAPGILRGLHYQFNPPQGKLVGAIRGRIYDVAVDVRPHSPTYGQHFGIELSDTNGLLMWVPAGFAHGFCVVGDEPADVMYKVTATYNPQGEGGFRFDDPDVGINWPIQNPTTSERDRNLPSFAAYKANPPKWA